MTTIDVETTVTIKDNMGRVVTTLTQSAQQHPGDNPRYWMTYARGGIQMTESVIAEMLKTTYGDVPKDPPKIVNRSKGSDCIYCTKPPGSDCRC